MAPAVLTHYVYTQRDRLKNQVRIQVLLPEHEEQQGRIHIAHIEILFAVPAGKKNRSKAEDCRQQIYQQHRLTAHFKQYYIPKLHFLSILQMSRLRST